MIEEFVMCRWMIVCLLCLMIAVPLYAQDNTPTPYEIALQRIEEAVDWGELWLDLSSIGLTELPPEIGQLANLQTLALHDNRLTNLPPEIGQLTNLQGLNLESNRLTSLPSEIGRLTNLERLILADNQLTILPSEIGELSNLQELDLFDNRLANLPYEIEHLINLYLLNLGENQLHYLPSEISKLDKLISLHLDNNPLISPPPEVVEQGTAAVLNYLRNQAWYHTQRLIVGAAGGVGLFALLVLCLRWKQRDGRKLKQKRV
jgi:internalin A